MVRPHWAARGTRGWPRCAAHRDAARALLGAPGATASCRRPAPVRDCARSSTLRRAVAARRRDARRVRFDRRDPARVCTARAHRARVRRGACRRPLRADDIVAAIGAPCRSGRRLGGCLQHRAAARRCSQHIVGATHAAGGRLLLDVYHSLGVLPVDVTAHDVDFAIGGSYKYLRGGPGACFLYLHPRHLDGWLRTLDIGWFAKRERFLYRRPDPPELAEGGDAFLESTPPVSRATRRAQDSGCARGGCRACPRIFAAAAAPAGRVARGAAAWRRKVERPTAVRSSSSPAPLADAWVRRARRARYRHRRTRSMAAVVPGRADAGRRSRRGCRRARPCQTLCVIRRTRIKSDATRMAAARMPTTIT